MATRDAGDGGEQAGDVSRRTKVTAFAAIALGAVAMLMGGTAAFGAGSGTGFAPCQAKGGGVSVHFLTSQPPEAPAISGLQLGNFEAGSCGGRPVVAAIDGNAAGDPSVDPARDHRLTTYDSQRDPCTGDKLETPRTIHDGVITLHGCSGVTSTGEAKYASMHDATLLTAKVNGVTVPTGGGEPTPTPTETSGGGGAHESPAPSSSSSPGGADSPTSTSTSPAAGAVPHSSGPPGAETAQRSGHGAAHASGTLPFTGSRESLTGQYVELAVAAVLVLLVPVWSSLAGAGSDPTGGPALVLELAAAVGLLAFGTMLVFVWRLGGSRRAVLSGFAIILAGAFLLPLHGLRVLLAIIAGVLVAAAIRGPEIDTGLRVRRLVAIGLPGALAGCGLIVVVAQLAQGTGAFDGALAANVADVCSAIAWGVAAVSLIVAGRRQRSATAHRLGTGAGRNRLPCRPADRQHRPHGPGRRRRGRRAGLDPQVGRLRHARRRGDACRRRRDTGRAGRAARSARRAVGGAALRRRAIPPVRGADRARTRHPRSPDGGAARRGRRRRRVRLARHRPLADPWRAHQARRRLPARRGRPRPHRRVRPRLSEPAAPAPVRPGRTAARWQDDSRQRRHAKRSQSRSRSRLSSVPA
jgi:hypothetical protein